jgi:hypothetical protein
MTGLGSSKSVEIDGVNVGELAATFETDDEVVAALRQRMSYIGMSYGLLETLAGLPEGGCGKYLSDLRVRNLTVSSLLKITSVLGLRAMLVVDEELTRQMQPMWERRDATRVHSRRLPRLSDKTIRRVTSAVAASMGARGGKARMRTMTPEARRQLGRDGARARWARRTRDRPQPPPATS